MGASYGGRREPCMRRQYQSLGGRQFGWATYYMQSTIYIYITQGEDRKGAREAWVGRKLVLVSIIGNGNEI